MNTKNIFYAALLFAGIILSGDPLSGQDLLPRGITPNGPIFGMKRKGEVLYLAGDFDKVGYVTGGAALFHSGSEMPDLDFPYIFGDVYEVIPDGNGGWFMGGKFSSVNEADVSNLIHILPDFKRDIDFQPDPNNRVNALALHNNILYVGGLFTGTASSSGAYLVAINTLTNSVSALSYQPDGEVTDLVIHDNHLIIGGRFRNVGGIAQRGLAKVDLSTGNLVAFPYLSASAVLSLAASDDVLYVGGDFSTQVMSNSLAYTRNRVFAVDLVKNEITAWAPNVGGTGFAHRVNALEVIDSLVYLGGAFNAVNGESRARLAAVSVSGTLAAFRPDPDAEVFALRAYNGSLLVGGQFLTIASTTQSFSALLDVSSGQLSDWDIAPDWAIRSFGLQNEQLLAGGQFRILKGMERDNACAFDLVTGELLDWSPQGGFLVGAGLLVDLFSDVVYLYGWDSNSMLNIKGFHSSTAENLPSFNIQLDNSVEKMIQDPNSGNIYFSGDFQSVNGQARKRLAGMDQSGNLLPLSVDIDGVVRSMALVDSVIYLGGRFNNINSQSRFKAAAVNLSGDLLPWFPEHDIIIQSADITIQFAQPDKVVITGSFSKIGSEERSKIAAVDPVHGKAIAWDPDANVNIINAFKTEGDGVFVSGNGLFSLSGILVNNLAYISLYSALPTQVFPDYGFNNIFAMETFENTLYMGGYFTQMDNRYFPYFATMQFQDLNFRGLIESVQPVKGGNTGDVTFEITGSGLKPGTRMFLGKNGIEELFAAEGSTVAFNETRLNATFDLRGQDPRFMDVIIEVPGDTTYVFENEFQITESEGALPWANIIAPEFVTVSKEEFFYLNYGNSGNVDAEGVPLWIAFSPNIDVIDFGMEIADLMDPGSLYYDSIPEYVLIDTLLGEPYAAKLYSFFIPRIPAGSSKTIAITIKGVSDGDFYTRAWTNEPYFGSPLKYWVGECADALLGAALNFVPVAGCAYGIMDVTLSPFVDPIYDPDFGSEAYVGNYFQTVAETSIGCALDATTGGVGRALVEIVDYVAKGKSIKNAYEKCQTPSDQEDQKGKFVASCDPNDKTGPAGQGEQGWLTTRRKFPYMVRFENEAEATAPAKKVIIRDTLDLSVFDPGSLELKAFSIGPKSFDIPPGKKEYSGIVDLRPGVNSLVNLEVKMDPISGELTWEFTGLDPLTLLPQTHPLDGFLPPNTDNLSGQGSVIFDLEVYDTITTGRVIANKAAIYFDFNEPIITNTWTLRADNHSPYSQVIALPDTQQQRNFTVRWEGEDNGSGIMYYDLLFREEGGPWKYAAVQTNENSIEFTGEPGRKYEFHAMAFDTALNREVKMAVAEASTFIAQGAVLLVPAIETGRVRLYPNPAGVELFVEITGFHDPVEIRVMDLSGRIVYLAKDILNAGSHRISLDGFAKGFYFLKWSSAEQEGSLRFIKL